jgi:hypothetical protein
MAVSLQKFRTAVACGQGHFETNVESEKVFLARFGLIDIRAQTELQSA